MRALIGPVAEELAYLYAACERRSLFTNAPDGTTLTVHDMFEKRHVPVTEPTLRALLEIEAANTVEGPAERITFPDSLIAQIKAAFERVRPLVTARAYEELQERTIDAIALTHLHGDHFGALPFLILDAQFRRRTAPLVVAGPRGVQPRVEAAMEVFFPGSTAVARRFAVDYVELSDGVATPVGGMTVTPFAVVHPSGAPAHALRVEDGGRVLTYSGDTEWTDRLLDAARDADLLVCEAYVYDRAVKFHLSHADLQAHRDALGCRRILLTHMGPDMLAHEADAACECARDGLVIPI